MAFIALGAVITLSAMLFQLEGPLSWSKFTTLLLPFLKDLGLALISLGLLGIVVNLKDWRDYFQERLRDIVVQREYLKKLGKADLIALQTDTLKAYYEDSDLDRQGRFLNYFHQRLSQLIASPYRLDLNAVLAVQHDRDGMLLVDDEISWRCRLVGKAIQDKIDWKPDEGEFESLDSLSISLTPRQEATAGSIGARASVSKAPRTISFEELKTAYCAGAGYSVSLSDFADCDGLHVQVRARYRIRKDRFIGWRMAHPTRGVHLTIHHPPDLQVSYEVYAIEDEGQHVSRGIGHFQFRVDGWMIPSAGIAVQLQERRDDDAVAVEAVS